MRLKDALSFGANELKNIKEARILLSFFLGKSNEWIFLHENEKMQEYEGFKALIKRRKEHEPLEYITKKASFYSRDFCVENGVLIPRPETELLVDLALKSIEEVKNPKVLEIGVGSGIISVMMAVLNQNASIVATDINEKAINLAKQNAKKFGVEDRIKFFHTSFEKGVVGEFDLLVSNPPYISLSARLEPHVLKEPSEALFSGDDGTDMLKELVLIAKERGITKLCCEMGYDQKNAMSEFLKAQNARFYEFYQDLSGFDRGFLAKF